MDEENNQRDQKTISQEHEEELLAADDVPDEKNPEFGDGQERIMAMMVKMNDNMNSLLTRLLRVEAAQGKPAAKKRRIDAITEDMKQKRQPLIQSY